MKRKTKIALTVFSAVAGLIAAFGIWHSIRNKEELAKFRPAATGQVDTVVCALRDDFVDVFVLRKNGKILAVDAGHNAKHVAAGLESLGIDPKDVGITLLTHIHYDHIAAIGLFANSSLYLSEREASPFANPLARLMISGHSYSVLKDGEEIVKDGWTINTIVTPGHTVGSACYLIDGKYLFTGDTLSLTDGRIRPFNPFFNVDTKRQIRSISKIASLDSASWLLTAHYGASENPAALFARWKSEPRVVSGFLF